MYESATERRAMLAGWDTATIGAFSVPGIYDEPTAEALLMEGTAPTFLAARSDIEAAGVQSGPVAGTTIESIAIHDGRTRGPFMVVRWMPEDDGAFVMLGLQSM